MAMSRRDLLSFAPKSLLFGIGVGLGSGAGLGASGLAHALEVPSYRSVRFDIIGDGTKIGHFAARLSGSASSTLTAETRVMISSRIYSVSATNVETWTRRVLTRFTGQGNDNGRDFSFDMSGAGDGTGLRGDDNRGRALATPQSAIPTTYWNRDFRRASRVLNGLEGSDFGVRATELGVGQIETGYGIEQVSKVRVQGIGLGLYNVVLSYDALGDWAGMEFSIFGFDVQYRRVS